MPRYKVNQNYRSRRDGVDYGPWEAGGVIDLSEADADWVNRDSPGTLGPAEEPATKKTDAGDNAEGGAAQRQQKTGRDRQQKPAGNRAAT